MKRPSLHSDAHGIRIREEWNLQYEGRVDASTSGSSKLLNARINAVILDALLKQNRRDVCGWREPIQQL